MEFRTLKFDNYVKGHTHAMSLLFSMFSNLDAIDSFAKEYDIPSSAKSLVTVLLNGLNRVVAIRYNDVKVKTVDITPTNTVIVAFSGGKDSTATAMKLKNDGYDVRLFYVKGINKSYSDEIDHAKRLADELGLPLHVANVTQHGKTSFKESPVKNQLIASMALDYAIENGYGCTVAFGDFTTDNIGNSQFYESWSDTQEMWSAWLELVRTYVPNAELIIPFETYNETLDMISERRKILEMVCGCILPYRFRAMTRNNNESKFGIRLLPNRCGSCWKCCTEYVFLADKGVIPFNKAFYDHCLEFLVKKLPSVRPEITQINVRSAYEAFLHRPFSKSVINK